MENIEKLMDKAIKDLEKLGISGVVSCVCDNLKEIYWGNNKVPQKCKECGREW